MQIILQRFLHVIAQITHVKSPRPHWRTRPGVEGDYWRGTALEKRRLLTRDWGLYLTQSNIVPMKKRELATAMTASLSGTSCKTRIFIRFAGIARRRRSSAHRMAVRIRLKMAERKKSARHLLNCGPHSAFERLAANEGWVTTPVKAVSRWRRGPKTRLCVGHVLCAGQLATQNNTSATLEFLKFAAIACKSHYAD